MPRPVCLHLVDEFDAAPSGFLRDHVAPEVAASRSQRHLEPLTFISTGYDFFPFPMRDLESGARIVFQNLENVKPRRSQRDYHSPVGIFVAEFYDRLEN